MTDEIGALGSVELARWAYEWAQGDSMAALQACVDVAGIARRAVELERAARFGAELVAVRRVKASNESPGKCEITLRTRSDDATSIEHIETDWLSDPVAMHIARTAQRHLGRQAVLWKLNDADPTGKVSQGFRRVIWIAINPATRKESSHGEN